MRKLKQTGFTLLELLIVIAIIGVLASITILSYPNYTKKARQANAIRFSDNVRGSLQQDMVAWWKFDETSGTIATDSWWDQLHGAVNGATWVPGIKNNALSFDGINDYVNLTGISLNNGGNLTIAFWANFLAYDGSDYIVDIEAGRLLIGLYGNNFNFYDNAWKNYGSGVACASYLNDWHHYVFIFDTSPNPDVAKLYIDGKLMGSNNTYSAKNISGNISLMSRFSKDQAFVKGLIDDLQVYSAALPVAVIQQHYALGLKTHQNFLAEK